MGSTPSSPTPSPPFLGTPTPLTGEFFIGSTSTMNRAAAVLACEAQDAVLASVHTDEEWYQIRNTCINQCGSASNCGCWMGFKDDGTEGIWLNDDNTYQDYIFFSDGTPDLTQPGGLPWYDGEPNNAGSGGEDCVHSWSSQSFSLNDIPCTSNYYPMCRKIDFGGLSQARKCMPGYDNDEYGECSIPLACWGSDTHFVGDTETGSNDIAGCGLDGDCNARYGQNSVAECNERCRTTSGCVAYTWTSFSGDQSHPNEKVCTLYDSATPNQDWGTNQIMCEVCGLPAAHAALPDIDAETFVHKHLAITDEFDNSTWMELLAINAAVSAAVAGIVMALFMTVWCLCVRTKKRGPYAQVDKLAVDVDEDEEEQIIAA